jgi:hypothetical protein
VKGLVDLAKMKSSFEEIERAKLVARQQASQRL